VPAFMRLRRPPARAGAPSVLACLRRSRVGCCGELAGQVSALAVVTGAAAWHVPWGRVGPVWALGDIVRQERDRAKRRHAVDLPVGRYLPVVDDPGSRGACGDDRVPTGGGGRISMTGDLSLDVIAGPPTSHPGEAAVTYAAATIAGARQMRRRGTSCRPSPIDSSSMSQPSRRGTTPASSRPNRSRR
jgi:hypothetical protein